VGRNGSGTKRNEKGMKAQKDAPARGLAEALIGDGMPGDGP
jgi:hypothetical protein